MKKADKEHLNSVAELGCAVCGHRLVEIHHVTTGSGMGRKNPDSMAIPLCLKHHRGMEGLHHLGTHAWEEKFGTQEYHLSEVYRKLGKDIPVIASKIVKRRESC